MPSYNLILWPLLSLPYCKQHEAGKSLGTRLVSVSEEISSLHTRSHAHTGRVHCPTCNRCDLPNHSCDTRYVLLAVFVHSDSSRHKVSFHLASLCPLTPPLVPPLLSTDPPSGVTSVGHQSTRDETVQRNTQTRNRDSLPLSRRGGGRVHYIPPSVPTNHMYTSLQVKPQEDQD